MHSLLFMYHYHCTSQFWHWLSGGRKFYPVCKNTHTTDCVGVFFPVLLATHLEFNCHLQSSFLFNRVPVLPLHFKTLKSLWKLEKVWNLSGATQTSGGSRLKGNQGWLFIVMYGILIDCVIPWILGGKGLELCWTTVAGTLIKSRINFWFQLTSFFLTNGYKTCMWVWSYSCCGYLASMHNETPFHEYLAHCWSQLLN